MKKSILNTIKIPHNVFAYYCTKSNYLLIKGNLGIRFLKLKLKLSLKNRILKIKPIFLNSVSRNEKKNLKNYFKHVVTLIKKNIFEVSIFLLKKLKFIGLGYRFFLFKNLDNFFQFKLGYSHSLFFKIPCIIKFDFFKNTSLYLKSNDFFLLTQISSKIRLLKKPEPYKGKGILYENEKVNLKKGKKI